MSMGIAAAGGSGGHQAVSGASSYSTPTAKMSNLSHSNLISTGRYSQTPVLMIRWWHPSPSRGQSNPIGHQSTKHHFQILVLHDCGTE